MAAAAAAAAAAHPAWARRAQEPGVALPFCGLSDVGCAGDTPSCDCVTFLFTCDTTTSGCSPLTLGMSVLVIGTVLLLLCCCCGGTKSEGYEGAHPLRFRPHASTATATDRPARRWVRGCMHPACALRSACLRESALWLCCAPATCACTGSSLRLAAHRDQGRCRGTSGRAE